MSKKAHILMIEDNPGDIKLVQEALSKTGFIENIAVVTDGHEAVEYLKQEGGYAEAAKPDIVLLDLNLPKQHGLEILRTMRETDSHKKTPVMVLTSSDNPKETDEAYSMAASLFMTKPTDVSEFNTFAEALETYWTTYLQADA